MIYNESLGFSKILVNNVDLKTKLGCVLPYYFFSATIGCGMDALDVIKLFLASQAKDLWIQRDEIAMKCSFSKRASDLDHFKSYEYIITKF